MKNTSTIIISIGLFLIITVANYIIFHKPLSTVSKTENKDLLNDVTSLKSSITLMEIDNRFSKISQKNTEFNREASDYIARLREVNLMSPQNTTQHTQIITLKNKNKSVNDEIEQLKKEISDQQKELDKKISDLEKQIQDKGEEGQIANWKNELSLWIQMISTIIPVIGVCRSRSRQTVSVNA